MENQSEVVSIDSIETLAHVVTHWHERNVATLEHTMRIPEGTAIEFDEYPEIVLEGDLHKGFRMGVAASLVAIGELPFFGSKDTTDAPVDVQYASASDETH